MCFSCASAQTPEAPTAIIVHPLNEMSNQRPDSPLTCCSGIGQNSNRHAAIPKNSATVNPHLPLALQLDVKAHDSDACQLFVTTLPDNRAQAEPANSSLNCVGDTLLLAHP